MYRMSNVGNTPSKLASPYSQRFGGKAKSVRYYSGNVWPGVSKLDGFEESFKA